MGDTILMSESETPFAEGSAIPIWMLFSSVYEDQQTPDADSHA